MAAPPTPHESRLARGRLRPAGGRVLALTPQGQQEQVPQLQAAPALPLRR